jgi:hypothetical protein
MNPVLAYSTGILSGVVCILGLIGIGGSLPTPSSFRLWRAEGRRLRRLNNIAFNYVEMGMPADQALRCAMHEVEMELKTQQKLLLEAGL